MERYGHVNDFAARPPISRGSPIHMAGAEPINRQHLLPRRAQSSSEYHGQDAFSEICMSLLRLTNGWIVN